MAANPPYEAPTGVRQARAASGAEATGCVVTPLADPREEERYRLFVRWGVGILIAAAVLVFILVVVIVLAAYGGEGIVR